MRARTLSLIGWACTIRSGIRSDLKGALMSLFRDRIPVGLPRSIEAIRDVSFTIRSGERVGIVGANGAGKSSLMRVIAGIYRPTRGRVESQGFIVPLLQVGLGFHFEMTARANILQAGIILGIDRRDMEARTQDILEFAELSGFADLPLKVLSSGMATRLAFATATEVSADILLLDEVLRGGGRFLQGARRPADGGSHRSYRYHDHGLSLHAHPAPPLLAGYLDSFGRDPTRRQARPSDRCLREGDAAAK